jgi:hypothetical protein
MSKHTAAVDYHRELTAVRNTIADMRAERREIEGAPRPTSAAKAERERRLARLAALIDVDVKSLRDPRVSASDTLTLFRVANPHQPLDALTLHSAIVARVLAPIYRDVSDRALAAADQEHPPGLPMPERVKALAKLDAQLADLELEEESIIEAAETVGIELPRRHDANPAAVLRDPASSEARDKYDRLAERARQQNAAVVDLHGRLADAHDELGKARDVLRRRTEEGARTRMPVDPVFEREVQRLETEAARLNQAYESAEGAWQAAAAIVGPLREYLHNAGVHVSE